MIARRIFLIGAGRRSALSGCGGKLLDIGPPDAGPVYTVLPKFPPATAGRRESRLGAVDPAPRPRPAWTATASP